MDVEGAVLVRASLTGNGSPSSGRQLGRGGSGSFVCQIGGANVSENTCSRCADVVLLKLDASGLWH